MQSPDQQEAAPRPLLRYLPWFLGVAAIVVLVAWGKYAAALGAALGLGIVAAGAIGLIPEQGPSKAGNVVAIILVVAIVLVIAFVWWVVHGA